MPAPQAAADGALEQRLDGAQGAAGCRRAHCPGRGTISPTSHSCSSSTLSVSHALLLSAAAAATAPARRGTAARRRRWRWVPLHSAAPWPAHCVQPRATAGIIVPPCCTRGSSGSGVVGDLAGFRAADELCRRIACGREAHQLPRSAARDAAPLSCLGAPNASGLHLAGGRALEPFSTGSQLSAG